MGNRRTGCRHGRVGHCRECEVDAALEAAVDIQKKAVEAEILVAKSLHNLALALESIRSTQHVIIALILLHVLASLARVLFGG